MAFTFSLFSVVVLITFIGTLMMTFGGKVIHIDYPYHTGETDVGKLVELLKECPEIEVRVRKMK